MALDNLKTYARGSDFLFVLLFDVQISIWVKICVLIKLDHLKTSARATSLNTNTSVTWGSVIRRKILIPSLAPQTTLGGKLFRSIHSLEWFRMLWNHGTYFCPRNPPLPPCFHGSYLVIPSSFLENCSHYHINTSSRSHHYMQNQIPLEHDLLKRTDVAPLFTVF